MTRPVSLFILAGEESGDRLGAALVQGMRDDADVRLAGIGGRALLTEGLRPLFPMSDLSVMGFSDVIWRLPKLLLRLAQATREIIRLNPDVVVLIDSQVFTAAVARRLRKKGYRGPVVLYVAPSVWAWKPERAPALKGVFDRILAILPFEPAVMEKLGGPETHYVGHPALLRFPFRRNLPESGPLLLLPGSRDGEIARTLPMMEVVAARFAGNPRVTGFILPTPSSRQASMAAATANWKTPVTVVSDEPGRLDAYARAIGAVVVSGTATLELALAGVPMVTTYVADAGQAKRFLKYEVKFVSLPNIVLDRPVVPEMLFAAPDAEKLTEATLGLIGYPGALDAQVAAFAELRARMESGDPEAPIQGAAGIVLDVLASAQRASTAT